MKKKGLIILIICMSILSAGILYTPFYLRNKEINDLEKQGNELAQKVELYKQKNHKLPQYLEDMKLNLPDDYPLYYNTTKDSGVYVISFQLRFFKSMAYYSNTKKWEYHN